MWQRIAWTFLGLGTVVLLGWGVWEFVIEDEIPLWVRLAMAAVALGSVLITGYVLRDRLKEAKTDEYKEVRW